MCPNFEFSTGDARRLYYDKTKLLKTETAESRDCPATSRWMHPNDEPIKKPMGRHCLSMRRNMA